MVLAQYFLFLAMFWPQQNLLDQLADFAQPFQHLCLTHIGDSAGPQQKALVCGAKIKDQSVKQLYQSSGIYHLLVVSGAHLQLIASWFRRKPTRIKNQLSLLAILAYTLFTGAHLPVLRALTQIVFFRLASHLRMNWLPAEVHLVTTCFLLFLQPAVATNLSFLLSWSASLMLVAFSKKWISHLVIFIVLLFVLPTSLHVNPLVLPFSYFFSVFTMPILLTLSLLTYPFYFSHSFISDVFSYIEGGIGYLIYLLPPVPIDLTLSPWIVCLLLTLTNLILILLQKHRRLKPCAL